MAATTRGNGRIKSAIELTGRVKRLLLGPAKEFVRIAPESENVFTIF